MEDGSETDNPHEQFWYQDKEMADWTRARYEASRGKKMQYVSARINGTLIPYNSESHIKLNTRCVDEEFTVEPVFVNEARDAVSDGGHASVQPRVVILSCPVIQTGPTTFRYDPDYFGHDPKHLWSGITLCIEADGDDTYKSAVQELNIQR